jgi:hypothetical protein
MSSQTNTKIADKLHNTLDVLLSERDNIKDTTLITICDTLKNINNASDCEPDVIDLTVDGPINTVIDLTGESKIDRINDELQKAMQLLFEVQENIGDGNYVELCRSLKEINDINNEEEYSEDRRREENRANASVINELVNEEETDDDDSDGDDMFIDDSEMTQADIELYISIAGQFSALGRAFRP